jgi:hypothetical protein
MIASAAISSMQMNGTAADAIDASQA